MYKISEKWKTLNTSVKTRIFYTCAGLFLILFLSYALYDRRLLEANHVLVFGMVHDVGTTGRARVVKLSYTYDVGGKSYEDSRVHRFSELPWKVGKALNGKSFPVLYCPEKQSLSILLVLPEDFERFEIPFPDSLQWLLPMVEKYKT